MRALGMLVLAAGVAAAVMWPHPACSSATLDAMGMSNWTIVLADQPIASERYAAEEFQALFAAATGLQLPIVATTQSSRNHVFIGHGQTMANSSAGFGVDYLGEEGLRIHISPDNIAIAGGRPRGTLYGVYEFFERYAGVRFLTYDHTHVPEPQKMLLIPCEEHTYQPPFSYRYSYYTANQDHPELAARLRINTVTEEQKLGGISGQRLINHSYYRLLPVEQYGAEHPEYFALINGERMLNVGGGGPEPCTTNPDVVRIVTEAVLAELRAHPDWENISVSQNDNDLYCQCQRCATINAREESPMGANLFLVNAVADAVAKEFPGVKVGALSYWYTRKPPRFMRPLENVQIQLCSIESSIVYPLDDPGSQKNADFARDFVEWGRICDNIWIWNYNTNFSAYNLPFPNLRAIGPNVRFFRRNHGKGVFMQANSSGGPGELSDLRNYVISRCLWDDSLDSWDLAEEFCHLHYGDAADLIIEYLTFIHDNVERAGVEPNCFGSAEEFAITAEVAQKALDYFERALAAASDPVVRGRVEKASICAYLAMIEAGGELEVENGLLVLNFPGRHAGIVDTYAALCAKYGVRMSSEQGSLADYLAQIRKHTAGVSVAVLENDTWRLAMLPAVNGKIITMKHKPTGRDLLRGLSPDLAMGGSLLAGRGTLEELAERGMSSSGAAFKVTRHADSILLVRALDDGYRLERTIRFPGDGSEGVRFETTLTHHGAAATDYQMKVHPEFNTVTRTNDSAVIGAYVRDGDAWTQVNRDWDLDHGPDGALLKEAAGGGFAYFNHTEGFGVLETYDPTEFPRPRLWWKGEWRQMNLELITPRVTLNRGETLSYAYQVEFLREPPR
jgi:hypothetical protein